MNRPAPAGDIRRPIMSAGVASDIRRVIFDMTQFGVDSAKQGILR